MAITKGLQNDCLPVFPITEHNKAYLAWLSHHTSQPNAFLQRLRAEFAIPGCMRGHVPPCLSKGRRPSASSPFRKVFHPWDLIECSEIMIIWGTRPDCGLWRQQHYIAGSCGRHRDQIGIVSTDSQECYYRPPSGMPSSRLTTLLQLVRDHGPPVSLFFKYLSHHPVAESKTSLETSSSST